MGLITKGVYDALRSDIGLTTLLATYAGAPCIFHNQDVPLRAPRPYIQIQFPMVQMPYDTKTGVGREVMADILAVIDAGGTYTYMDSINDQLIRILHRKPFPLDEGHVIIVEVLGPILMPTDDSVIATKVTLHSKSE